MGFRGTNRLFSVRGITLRAPDTTVRSRTQYVAIRSL